MSRGRARPGMQLRQLQIRIPEKRVQQAVKEVLELHRYHVSDLSQPRASMQTPGLPDLYAQCPHRGLRLWVEVKAAGGRLSEDQATWHARERAAGGTVVVVHSGSEMHDYLVDLHQRLGGIAP